MTNKDTYRYGITGNFPFKTGQITSYRTADDGNLRAGVAQANPRFQDNGNGSFYDLNTNLTWPKDPAKIIPGGYGTLGVNLGSWKPTLGSVNAGEYVTTSYPAWNTNTVYSAGDLRLENFILYENVTPYTSTAYRPTSDVSYATKWTIIPNWAQGTTYTAGNKVFDSNYGPTQLYNCILGNIASDHQPEYAADYHTYWTTWVGSINGSTTYTTVNLGYGDDGYLYRCILGYPSTESHVPVSDLDWATYWVYVGDPATVSYWSQYTSYTATTSVVQYWSGAFYQCRVSHYSSAHEPGVDPDASTYWTASTAIPPTYDDYAGYGPGYAVNDMVIGSDYNAYKCIQACSPQGEGIYGPITGTVWASYFVYDHRMAWVAPYSYTAGDYVWGTDSHWYVCSSSYSADYHVPGSDSYWTVSSVVPSPNTLYAGIYHFNQTLYDNYNRQSDAVMRLGSTSYDTSTQKLGSGAIILGATNALSLGFINNGYLGGVADIASFNSLYYFGPSTNTSFSFSAWVKTTDLTNPNTIANRNGYDPGTGNYNQWDLTINTDGTLSINVYGPGGTLIYTVTSTATISLNTWTFVAFTFANPTLTLYIGNTNEGSTTINTSTVIDFLNWQRSLCLGSAYNRVNSGPVWLVGTQPFIGEIDEVVVYRTGLTSTQITAIYNSGTGLETANQLGSDWVSLTNHSESGSTFPATDTTDWLALTANQINYLPSVGQFMSITASNKRISYNGGASLVAAGFTAGMPIIISGTQFNNGLYTISSVTSGGGGNYMVVSAGDTLVDEYIYGQVSTTIWAKQWMAGGSNWNTAIDLVAGLTWNGHNDWRVPNAYDYWFSQDISNLSTSNTPGYLGTYTGLYANLTTYGTALLTCSTTRYDNTANAWYFNNGLSYNAKTTTTNMKVPFCRGI